MAQLIDDSTFAHKVLKFWNVYLVKYGVFDTNTDYSIEKPKYNELIMHPLNYLLPEDCNFVDIRLVNVAYFYFKDILTNELHKYHQDLRLTDTSEFDHLDTFTVKKIV